MCPALRRAPDSFITVGSPVVVTAAVIPLAMLFTVIGMVRGTQHRVGLVEGVATPVVIQRADLETDVRAYAAGDRPVLVVEVLDARVVDALALER